MSKAYELVQKIDKYQYLTREDEADFTKQIEELCRREAIEFANFMSNHKLDFQSASNGTWIGLDMKYVTSDGAYQMFLQSKQNPSTNNETKL